MYDQQPPSPPSLPSSPRPGPQPLVITPATASLVTVAQVVTVVVSAPDQDRLNADDAQRRNHDRLLPSALHRKRDWFHTFAFFVPRSICEPWVGDIREKRRIMATEGYSRRWIECATASEIALLVLYSLKRVIMDILTPFKNR